MIGSSFLLFLTDRREKELLLAQKTNRTLINFCIVDSSGVPRGGVGVFKPPSKIPKAPQNRAKLNPICENC